MTTSRLPETVQTLYAELLDQLRAADAEFVLGGRRGSFVSKRIRGRNYWYLQKSEGATKQQIYLGPESPALLARMKAGAEQRAAIAEDERRRRELVSMLAAGGMFREPASIATVIQALADASVFRAGGVLVGTQAFSCLANLLGVAFEKESLRTADIDVAHDTTIPLASEERRTEEDMLERLRAVDPGFFAVPGLDPREPGTSFKVRGRDLRVDFLTPDKSHGRRSTPVVLRHLGIAAQPLQGLDYLLEGTIDAAVVAASGIRVNVPSPGRFAFHKMWVAAPRPASEAPKARKDLRQAMQVLEVLIEERPGDAAAAYQALGRRMLRSVRASMKKIDETMAGRIAALSSL